MLLKRVYLGCIFAMMAWANPVLAHDKKPSSEDLKMASELVGGGKNEVALGKLAQEKSTNSDVRDFGERMAQDHAAMGDHIQQWASSKKVKIVNKEADSSDVALKKKLESLSGAEFDKAYMDAMLDDHKKDIAGLQKFIAKESESDFKKLLSDSLLVMENHMRVAQNVAGKIGVSPKSGLNEPEHP